MLGTLSTPDVRRTLKRRVNHQILTMAGHMPEHTKIRTQLVCLIRLLCAWAERIREQKGGAGSVYDPVGVWCA